MRLLLNLEPSHEPWSTALPINSKQKGKRGELELAVFLREHGFENARRGVQYKGGEDSPDCVGVPGHHIECKRVEALSLYAAYDQAVRDAAPGSVPLVAHRKNGKPHHPLPWLAILSLDDYLLMVRELEALRGK
jgi:Holliday junction resolvase